MANRLTDLKAKSQFKHINTLNRTGAIKPSHTIISNLKPINGETIETA
ncbi:MAG: hypothetical protein IK025_03840 [Bacteroidales bacterium]|nr:hypothetical protein [Bacteroidales bacterium]